MSLTFKWVSDKNLIRLKCMRQTNKYSCRIKPFCSSNMEPVISSNGPRIISDSESLLSDLELVCSAGEGHLLRRWSSRELLASCNDLLSRPIPSLALTHLESVRAPSDFDKYCENLVLSACDEIFLRHPEMLFADNGLSSKKNVEQSTGGCSLQDDDNIEYEPNYNCTTSEQNDCSTYSSSFGSCRSCVLADVTSDDSLSEFVSFSSVSSVSGKLASNVGVTDTETHSFKKQYTEHFVDRLVTLKSFDASLCKKVLNCLKRNIHYHSTGCISSNVVTTNHTDKCSKNCGSGTPLRGLLDAPSNARKCHSAIPLPNASPQEINSSQSPCCKWGKEIKRKEGNGSSASLPSVVPNDGSVCSQPRCQSCQNALAAVSSNLISDKVRVVGLDKLCKECAFTFIGEDHTVDDVSLRVPSSLFCDSNHDIFNHYMLLSSPFKMSQSVTSDNLTFGCVKSERPNESAEFASDNWCDAPPRNNNERSSNQSINNFNEATTSTDLAPICVPSATLSMCEVSQEIFPNIYHAIPAIVSIDPSEDNECEQKEPNELKDRCNENATCDTRMTEEERTVCSRQPFSLSLNSSSAQDYNNEVAVGGSSDLHSGKSPPKFISAAEYARFNMLSSEGRHESQHSVISGSASESQTSTVKGVKEEASSPPQKCASKPSSFGGIYFFVSPFVWWYPLFIPSYEDVNEFRSLGNFQWYLATSGEFWQLLLDYDGRPTIYQKEAMSGSAPLFQGDEKQSFTSKLCGFSISDGDNARVKTLLPVFTSKYLCNSARDVTNSVLLRPKNDLIDSNVNQRHSASGDVGSYRMDSIVLVPGGKPPYLPEGPPSPSSIKLCGITLGSVDHAMKREGAPSSTAPFEETRNLPISRIISGIDPLTQSEQDVASRKASLHLPLVPYSPSIVPSSSANPSNITPSAPVGSPLSHLAVSSASISKDKYSPDVFKPSLLSMISKDIPFGVENSSGTMLDGLSSSAPISDKLSSFPPKGLIATVPAVSSGDASESFNSASLVSTHQKFYQQHAQDDKASTDLVSDVKDSNSTSSPRSLSAYCTGPSLVSLCSASSPVSCTYCSFNVSPIPYGSGFGTSANTSRASSRSSCYEVDSGSTQPISFPPLFADINPKSRVEKADSASKEQPDGFTGPYMPLTHHPGTAASKELHQENVSDSSVVTFSSAAASLPATCPISEEICSIVTHPLSLDASCSPILKNTNSLMQSVPEDNRRQFIQNSESNKNYQKNKSHISNFSELPCIDNERHKEVSSREIIKDLQERSCKTSGVPSLVFTSKESAAPKVVDAAFKGSQNRNCGSKFPVDVLCRGRVFELQKKTTPDAKSEDSNPPNYPRRRLASFDHLQPFSRKTIRPYPTTRSKSAGRVEFGPTKLDLNKSFESKESCIDEGLESSIESLSLMSSTDLAGDLYNLQRSDDKPTTISVRHWDQSSLATTLNGNVVSYKFAPTSEAPPEQQSKSNVVSDKLGDNSSSPADECEKVLHVNLEVCPKKNVTKDASDLKITDDFPSLKCNQNLEINTRIDRQEYKLIENITECKPSIDDQLSLVDCSLIRESPVITASLRPCIADEEPLQSGNKTIEDDLNEIHHACEVTVHEPLSLSKTAEEESLLNNFCQDTVNSIFNWSVLQPLINESKKIKSLHYEPYEEKGENLFESAISVLVDEVSDEEERSPSPDFHEQEIFVSVLEVQQFIPNFGSSGSTSTLVDPNSPSTTPLHTPTPSTLPIMTISTEESEVSTTIDEDLSNDELLKDEFEDIHEKDSTSKCSDTASWSAYPSETEKSASSGTEKSTSSVCSSDCTLPIELQHEGLASASASSTGSAYSWESMQGPVARRELLPLDEDEDPGWKGVLSVPESDEEKTGYESDDDFESMDAEMRRLEEKLKKFELELGISSTEVPSESKGTSGTQVYLRQQDLEELRSFKLPSIYPATDKLRTKHLSLMKKDDKDFGVDSDCDSKSSNKASSNESCEMFLKSKVKLKPGDRRCRSAFMNAKQNSKDKTSNDSTIDSKEKFEEPNVPKFQAATTHSGLQDSDSQVSSECVISEDDEASDIYINQNCLGYLWAEDDGMTALDFDELEEFHLVDMENSVFFIFEDDEEDEFLNSNEKGYEYCDPCDVSPRTSDSESIHSFSERKSDKSFVSAFKNSFKKAAKYLGPKAPVASKNDSDLEFNSPEYENVSFPRKLSGVYNVPTGTECEVLSFESDCGDGLYSSGEYHASPAICIVTSDEDHYSSNSFAKVRHDQNPPPQLMPSQDSSTYMHRNFNLISGDESLSSSRGPTDPSYTCWYDVVKSPSACTPLQTEFTYQAEKVMPPNINHPFNFPSGPAPPVPPRSSKHKHKNHPYANLHSRHCVRKPNSDIEKEFHRTPPQCHSSTRSPPDPLPISNTQGNPFFKVDDSFATRCVENSTKAPSSSQAGNHINLPKSDPKSSPTRRSWPPRM